MDLSDATVIVMPAWTLGHALTLAQAEAHRALLLDALPILQNDPRLDLGSVTEIDASGVQLLLSLRATLAQGGQSLQLVDASPAVREALSRLGLTPQFPIAAEGPSR